MTFNARRSITQNGEEGTIDEGPKRAHSWKGLLESAGCRPFHGLMRVWADAFLGFTPQALR
ncbi:MAG: hypothetical protein DMF74_28525 [Acidobacteria bacterium]|nr:MAG: hypothetical protein DMF74_28525 [Acidobacteriota bacterium]